MRIAITILPGIEFVISQIFLGFRGVIGFFLAGLRFCCGGGGDATGTGGADGIGGEGCDSINRST
ncbi:hypothetical protein SDC9_177850 [bioreactor metagenome]|uniref:Uncharacterized protein n=1 Tax=bioreactor metagenome TaxID=1076179 RepID=A0A645GX85_9ZZZZ